MRIGEVAESVGVNPKTIRYYEDIGLLPDPERTPAGYRNYTTADVDRLVFVKTARRLGFTLAEVAEILAFREQGDRPCAYVLGVLGRQVDDLDRRIAELQDLRAELVALKARADHLPNDDACYCTVIEHAAAMSAPARKS
ncbi:MAG: heavy metal-responsive transcriptional regulator [Actinomycetota bacterium]|nr:heavy metal-responsive transcriptional regulator [Actinomycetota bacterium]